MAVSVSLVGCWDDWYSLLKLQSRGKSVNKLLKALISVVPVVISSLLISAHFLRHGQLLFMGIGLVPLVALLIRHPLSVRLTQGILVFATFAWIRTAYLLATARAAVGLPYTRLLIILCAVAGFTFASIFVFQAKTLREFYKL